MIAVQQPIELTGKPFSIVILWVTLIIVIFKQEKKLMEVIVELRFDFRREKINMYDTLIHRFKHIYIKYFRIIFF